MAEHVTICETGPRDGLQIAKSIMPTAVKTRWIAAIAAAGVPIIEVGSFVPPKLIPQMADTAEITRRAVLLPDVTIMALAPNLRGAQNAHAAGAHRISTPVSVSEGHSRANINKTPMEAVAEVRRMVEWVRAQPRQVPIEVGMSTTFGCSIDGRIPLANVLRIAAALAEAGADEITLADTVGYANPALIRETVRAVRAEVGAKLVGLHLHDTCGVGIANALAGLDEGIRRFDSSLAGLGGCPFAPGASGNIVTEDLVFMLESMGFGTGIDLEKLLKARDFLKEGIPAEPIHGNLAKAGIPRTYARAA